MNGIARPWDCHDVVVGVADTTETRAALFWAAEEADLRHRPLSLVHAIGDEVDAWLDLEPSESHDVTATLTAAAGRLLADARARVAQLFPGLSIHEHIPRGGTKASLRDLSRHAELVVLGNHSAKGHLTGAVEVMEPFLHEDLASPVVLVGHRTTPGEGILAIADGTPACAPTLDYAFSQAQSRGQRLTVALCLPDPSPTAAAQDLGLMDEVARMEARMGASILGFTRSLLHMQIAELHSRFADVGVGMVSDGVRVDELLARAAHAMDAIIVDTSYVRRLQAMVRSSTSADVAALTTVLPANRPPVPDLSAELVAQLSNVSGTDTRAPARALPLPEPAAPNVTPTHTPELVPIRVRRRNDERGPWKYFKRYSDDPDIS